MHFLDQAKIYIRSGAGGPGAVSFRREKFIEYGGPDGGEGGKGGDIIFEAVPGLNTLIDFRYTQHFWAPRGKGGAGSNRTGAGGDDLVIKVPIGTQVLADDEERTILADLTAEGQRITFLKGGDGGRGNASYKSSTNRAPRQHGTGWPGEELWVWLRLKLLADVGLVGLPNAGKSTFLNATTNAAAKVGDYPFTTLRPQLGVVRHKGREFVLADIPGLIEGAAEGAGIGDRFLGHVERCRALLHLVDAAGEDPVEAWEVVRGELEAYGAGLEGKPEILALSRSDLVAEEELREKSAALAEASGVQPLPISAPSNDGIERLLDRIVEALGGEVAAETADDQQPGRGLVPSMTIAITGGTGFVGSRLLNQVSEGRYETRALTRRSMKPRRNVTWVEGALDRPDSLRELVRGSDSIIHVAAVITGRTASDFDPCNVEGTRLLVAAAQEAGIRRFVHVSSLAAREPEVSLYGASKFKSEEVVRSSGLDYAIVRPPAVYGPGDTETLELFKWAKRGLVMLPPPGKASIIHADDLARLLLTLAQSEELSNAVYEPDDGSGGLTHQELAQALGNAVGRKALGLHMPKSALRTGAIIDQLIRGRKAKLTRDRAAYFCHPDWVSDPALAVPSKLWHPKIPLTQGLAETVQWYHAHGWL